MPGGVAVSQAGIAVGTAQYASPEQAMGKPLDGRSDVYSVGCVLYEMLVGRPPFTGRDPDAVLTRRLIESPAPLRELRPDVPDWVAAVVMRALARDPAQRFVSATALMA